MTGCGAFTFAGSVAVMLSAMVLLAAVDGLMFLAAWVMDKRARLRAERKQR